MRATLGGPEAFKLDLPVETGPLRRLEQTMIDLRHRRDTTANATAFAAAIPHFPVEEERFSVTDMRSRLTTVRGDEARRITNLLDGAACKVEAIRHELVRCAATEAVAVVLEMDEIEPHEERRGYDIAAISLIGSDYSIPVGLTRVDFPGGDRSRPHLVEHAAAIDLLDQFCADLADLSLGAPPPLISFDHRYAENAPLRRHFREMGLEFVLAVGETFNELGELGEPGESRLDRPQLSEQMRFGLDDTPPAPRVYSSTVEPGKREYLFGLRRPHYAIVHPRIDVSAGGLSGRRGFARAGELVDLATSFAPPGVVKGMHLLDFMHANDGGWEKAAYLLAAYWAARLERLPIPDRP